MGGFFFALLLSQPGVDVVVFCVFGYDPAFEFGGYEVGAFFLPGA
jgi:hypothetical protein